jgi:NADH-quinone oxidoreductase subunit G
VILFGSEGMGLAGSTSLAQACARLLQAAGHTGKANNGLIGVWPNGNTQGAWDMGFRPAEDLAAALGKALVAYIAGADPAGDDPALALPVERAAFVVVQDLFLTETAKLADVVLPAVPYTEREGTYTSGERRVQRFYPAVIAKPGPRADFAIFAQVGALMKIQLEARVPALIFNQIAVVVAAYQGLTYLTLSQTPEQWPIVGRSDLYYGGTTYGNTQGVGFQLSPAVQRGEALNLPEVSQAARLDVPDGMISVMPVTRLYDRGTLISPSGLLEKRLAAAALWMHPDTAASFDLAGENEVLVTLSGHTSTVQVVLDGDLPVGVALAPRSVGLPVSQPQAVALPKEVMK